MLTEIDIPAIDPSKREEIQQRIDMKTKPPGSLGRIEEVALAIALVQGIDKITADPAQHFIFAGDHGMTVEGVSAWPSDVTAQMVLNFLAGGAAANAFANTHGIPITVVDAGVSGDLPDHPDLIRAGIRRGTRNAMNEDAMTADEANAALAFGAALAGKAAAQGAKTVMLGEMGIGNTSSAALIAHAIEGIDLKTLTGPGAGLDGDGVSRKLGALAKIAERRPGRLAPFDALCAFGGLEIAAMAGAHIGAASKGAIVLVDGFIATAAAMIAIRARPEVAPYTLFSHRSKEPGHQAVLAAMGAKPLLDLDLRLGEGTGSLLAFPLLRAACAMYNDMATFESAGVSGKD